MAEAGKIHSGTEETALVVSTYNWPEALAAVLRSVVGQRTPPTELIIADDGSDARTAAAVESVLRGSRLNWCHVRQHDAGFRQARARNLGVRWSRSPRLIFIDHDTILHPDFVGDHLRLSSEGSFLQGKRVFLPEGISRRILEDPASAPNRFSPWLRGLENRKNAVRCVALGRLFAWRRRFQTALRGCNISVGRDDFLAVDGYDETFDGVWGREDSDFCYRLFHRGVTCRNLWFAGLQFHLHHPSVKRRKRDHLDEELDRVRVERRVRALRGFCRMDQEGEILNAGGVGGWSETTLTAAGCRPAAPVVSDPAPLDPPCGKATRSGC
jgi:glycosyltransferase involved in cell wall biosynthesis